METLGVWLRQTREAEGWALKDVEEATCIRARFLEMLEAGEFAAFPGGDVQVRGFLRIYARHLNLSPEEVLARYNAETRGARTVSAGAPAGAQPVSPAPVAMPRWVRVEVIVAATLTALIVIVVGARYLLTRNGGGEETEATPAATASPVAAVSTTETSTEPAATPTFPADPSGGVTLVLEATEHVWTCVTADGTTEFEGMLATGQTESWSGREAVTVDAGNGAGLLVTVNGQSQGTMCGRGEVCIRAWGPGGEIHAP
jgi:cytoskeletal protein RodZ